MPAITSVSWVERFGKGQHKFGLRNIVHPGNGNPGSVHAKAKCNYPCQLPYSEQNINMCRCMVAPCSMWA